MLQDICNISCIILFLKLACMSFPKDDENLPMQKRMGMLKEEGLFGITNSEDGFFFGI